MNTLIQIQSLFLSISYLDIIEILIVAFLIYKLYRMLVNTRAASLVKGLVFIVFITGIFYYLNLHVVSWLLSKGLLAISVALPVVFQPELRKALEQIGRGRLVHKRGTLDSISLTEMIDEVVEASTVMSRDRVGALIVFERNTGLDDYINNASVKIDGIVSSALIQNIFVKDTPLHDKAVIVRGNRVYAACVELPLCRERSLSSDLGTRHSAAVGITEESDAYVLVVSEETGIISIAHKGKLNRRLNAKDIREMLLTGLAENVDNKNDKDSSFLNKISDAFTNIFNGKQSSDDEGGKK